jgi:hypothetical protein
LRAELIIGGDSGVLFIRVKSLSDAFLIFDLQNKSRGRPPKRSAERNEFCLDALLDEAEKAACKEASEIPMSPWVRERLRNAARREPIEAGNMAPFGVRIESNLKIWLADLRDVTSSGLDIALFI